MTTVKSQQKENLENWRILFYNSVIGMVFMLINFSEPLERLFLTSLGNGVISTFLIKIVELSQTIFNSIISIIFGQNAQAALQTLMSLNFIGLWLYIIILMLFTIRHIDFLLFCFAIAGLLIGIFIVPIVSWVIIAFVTILGFLLSLLGIIFVFILYNWWTILAIIGLVLIYVFRKYFLQFVIGIVIIVGIKNFIYPPAISLWQWFVNLIQPIVQFINIVWTRFIAPLFGFLKSIADWIIGACLYILKYIIIPIGILASFGHLVLDQFICAWHAGNSRKGVILGTFAIGTSLSLIFLTSVGNPELANSMDVSWTLALQKLDQIMKTDFSVSGIAQAQLSNLFAITIPEQVYEVVLKHLTTINAPLYDAFMMLPVLTISYIGILRRIKAPLEDSSEEIPVVFVPMEFLLTLGLLAAQVYIIYLQVQSESGEYNS